ncbi:MAG: hypothetical protein V6Z86_07270, partial [Hyphomicrobiales bacterium]
GSDGRLSADWADAHRMACSLEPFTVMTALRAFYRKRLSKTQTDRIIVDIREGCSFSNHIVDKAADFIKSGKIYFKREAQFPPTSIRRPEKNLYFATSFTMAMTKFFVECHKILLDQGNDCGFVLENFEQCDRCSMRLVQNLYLYLKPFSFKFLLLFKATDTADPVTDEDLYAGRFRSARKHCLRKFLNVVVATGGCADFIDTESLIGQIDLATAYQAMRAQLKAAEPAPLAAFADCVYKNGYETFYALKSLHDETPWLNDEDAMELERLLLLCDSYNYLFDEVLSVAAKATTKADDIDKCYFLLIAGLIKLKKHNDNHAALDDFEAGLAILEALPESLVVVIERAFLCNARNFARLLSVMTTKKGEARIAGLHEILSDEHRLLCEVCDGFVSAHKGELTTGNRLLGAMFIITTLVENIAKLNALCGLYSDTMELYKSYDYIFDTVAERMRGESYKRSFTISYSHALLHKKIEIAQCYGRLHNHRKAYEITKELLLRLGEYDVTGDYRGFVLNAHALNASRLGKGDEAIDALIAMARISVDYNAPYMLKSAVNSLSAVVAEHDLENFKALKSLSMIEDGFKQPDEAVFRASAAMDLENPFTGGLDQLVFGQQRQGELRHYMEQPRGNLNAAYKSYGLWQQIFASTQTDARQSVLQS